MPVIEHKRWEALQQFCIVRIVHVLQIWFEQTPNLVCITLAAYVLARKIQAVGYLYSDPCQGLI